MAAIPLLEEANGSPSGALIAGLAGTAGEAESQAEAELSLSHRPGRKLAIYPASAGFDLVDELDYLCARTIEPNLFFNPHFLAPAMPRLEDREVRLAVIRDDDGAARSRLRLLVPFSVERPATPFGVSTLRTWANPFGPLGTPLLDRDDPAGVMADFLEMLSRPHLRLPKVLVLPDMRLDGPVAAVIRDLAAARGLAVETVNTVERPFLESRLDGDEYLRLSLRPHHFREFRRLKRRLGDLGELAHHVATEPEEVRFGVEAFLSLEAAGWKGRRGTAMAIDRFRAAFAREAINGLAEQGMARIHTLTLDGRPIAALVVFLERGKAYTWKTAYDETLRPFSPGTLLMIEVTQAHLADPEIRESDSCAVYDHPVMSRLWTERRPIGTMAIGLLPGSGRAVAQAAHQLQLYRETRNTVRLLRNRIRALLNLR